MWKALGVVVLLAVLVCTCGGGVAGAYYYTMSGTPSAADAGAAPGASTTPADAPLEATPANAPDPTAMPRGRAAYEAEKYDDALAAFDQAVHEAPDDPAPLSWRGRTYARLERLDRAESDLSDASKRLPGDLETWRSLGWVRDRKGDDQEALAAWDHAIELAPADAKLKLSRANTNFKLGKRLAAVDDATAACDLGLPEGCTLRDRLHGAR